MTNHKQAAAILEAVRAVYEAICITGEQGAPAGVIYAALMGQGCTLSQYQGLEGILVRSGIVRKEGHLLIANDPSKKI